MNTITIISIAFITFITFNIAYSLFDLVTAERSMVKQGQPPLSNFNYYYVIFPYLVGLVAIILLLVFNNVVYQPTTWWGITITCIIIMVVYALLGVITSLVLSLIQANRNKSKESS
jgi:hypothetical protein